MNWHNRIDRIYWKWNRQKNSQSAVDWKVLQNKVYTVLHCCTSNCIIIKI